jgi:hypothetical protein
MLRDAKVAFTCRDNPHVNPRTIHTVAALAEHEVARKAKGKLNPQAQARGNQAAAQKVRRQADEYYAPLYALVIRLCAEGKTMQQIADHFNEAGYETRKKRRWTRMQVMLLLRRAVRLAAAQGYS